jgi:hypothetical protein
MQPQFKDMNDLSDYLNLLEQRIATLERENQQLPVKPSVPANVDGNMIAGYVRRILPQTNIISVSFFKRAFAIWGHFFVANLIIGISFGILYFCLAIVFFGSVFGNMVHK